MSPHVDADRRRHIVNEVFTLDIHAEDNQSDWRLILTQALVQAEMARQMPERLTVWPSEQNGGH